MAVLLLNVDKNKFDEPLAALEQEDQGHCGIDCDEDGVRQ